MRLFSLGKNEGGAPWRRRCVYIYCKYERRSCEVIMRLGVLRPFVRRPVIHFFPFMRGKNGRRRVGCSILISSLPAKATWIQLTPHSLTPLLARCRYPHHVRGRDAERDGRGKYLVARERVTQRCQRSSEDGNPSDPSPCPYANVIFLIGQSEVMM